MPRVAFRLQIKAGKEKEYDAVPALSTPLYFSVRRMRFQLLHISVFDVLHQPAAVQQILFHILRNLARNDREVIVNGVPPGDRSARRNQVRSPLPAARWGMQSPHLRVLRLRLFQDGNVGVGILPRSEEILLGTEDREQVLRNLASNPELLPPA
jgi:hypothetical protein